MHCKDFGIDLSAQGALTLRGGRGTAHAHASMLAGKVDTVDRVGQDLTVATFRRSDEVLKAHGRVENDPSRIAEEVIRRGEGAIGIYYFWFEFPTSDVDEILRDLRAHGAQVARRDGGNETVLVEARAPFIRDLAAVCLDAGGYYDSRHFRW